jgi:succinyl-CoA synthetase alpha subunit
MVNNEIRLTRPEFRKAIISKNTFRDSVFLLKVTEEVRRLPGVREALVGMGTDTNLQLIKTLGLWGEELATVQSNDLVVVVGGVNQEAVERAISAAQSLLEGVKEESQYSTLEQALSALPDPSLVVISIPGKYVKEVALPLVEKGINIHIFSDNVPLEDEVLLKRTASQKGCFVLGPGAGTVLVRGVGTGFANKVNPGPVGISSASGTGLQELSSMLSESGTGISYGLGVGGNDVKDQVGGIMMLQSLKFLDEDPDTTIINVVSKVPDPSTAEKVMRYADGLRKPTVVTLLGLQGKGERRGNVIYSRTIHQAAASTARLLGRDVLSNFLKSYHLTFEAVKEIASSIHVNGRVVALLTGGTFANEGTLILSSAGLRVGQDLSSANAVIDLGEEEYTRGRPHPMIDPTIRINMLRDLAEEEVSLVLMDFVLGFGAHSDPVGAHAEAINQLLYTNEKRGGKVFVLAHLCGTSGDPQGLREQEDKLRSLGVTVMPSNALTFLVAAGAITGDWERLRLLHQQLVEVVQ